MISKSLSRKSPSFNQLAAYMKESGFEGAGKSDARYEIYHHCFSRNRENLAAEFYANSQALAKRKNGNYLYHEILSITVEDGVDRNFAKRSLRELAERYIAERAPNNMVYGCLHDDHADHIHYHLMISANEKGESKRTRLSKARFDEIKRDIEEQCLRDYPELKQRPVMGASREDKQLSRKAAEVKRQGKKLDRQDYARKLIVGAMVHSASQGEFVSKLEAQGVHYYTRGKNHGIELQHPDGKVEKYRFATLGVHEDYEHFLSTVKALDAASFKESEPAHEAPNFGKSQSKEDKNFKEHQANEQEEPPIDTHRQEKREVERRKHDQERVNEKKRNFEKSVGEKEKQSAKVEPKTDQREDDVRRKKAAQDAAGVGASIREKSKPKPASEADIKREAERAKQETIDRLTREFKAESDKQKQSDKNKQGRGQK